MKVYRLHRWGKKTSQLVTFVDPHMPDPTRPQPSTVSTAEEMMQRIRNAKRRHERDFGLRNATLPLNPDAPTRQELLEKYSADIDAGRELQRRMFGRSN